MADAARVGVRRMLTVGIDDAGNERAIANAEAHEAVFACVGRHPNATTDFDDAAAARIEELAAIRASLRSARPASISIVTTLRARPARGVRGPHMIARRLAKPLVIHVRDGAQSTDGEALAQTSICSPPRPRTSP